MANNNLHLEVSHLHMDPLQSTTDEYIMQQECHLDRYTPAQQLDLNLVRMWLQVTTLADMCDKKRSNRIRLSYLDAQATSARFHAFVSLASTTAANEVSNAFVETFYSIELLAINTILEGDSSG